jgi:hypothetical protein
MDTVKIFVSYSHQNSDWVDEGGEYNLIPWLKKQLEQYNVVFWTDHALRDHVGEEFKKKIKQNIDDSNIALLMISQEFATSDFITKFELPWIREAFDIEKLKIIPLLLTKLTPSGKKKIEWLFGLQIIPNDKKTIIESKNDDIKWVDIKNDILVAIENKVLSIRKERTVKKKAEETRKAEESAKVEESRKAEESRAKRAAEEEKEKRKEESKTELQAGKKVCPVLETKVSESKNCGQCGRQLDDLPQDINFCP